jgi:hypothetical protein
VGLEPDKTTAAKKPSPLLNIFPLSSLQTGVSIEKTVGNAYL